MSSFTLLPLSFGLELETIFCFQEELLQRHLNINSPNAVIYKNLSPSTKGDLRQDCYEQQKYASWAFIEPDAWYPETFKPYSIIEGTNVKCRAYKDEPLCIARDLLSVLPERQKMVTHWRHSTKQTSYENWSLSNDPSLSGVSKTTMVKELGPQKVLDLQSWDSWGVEIISPPYLSVETAIRDTTEIISILSGSPSSSSAQSSPQPTTPPFTHGLLTSSLCAFQVHIGQPNNAAFSLSTIQHLAYILILFEEATTPLHTTVKRNVFGPQPGFTSCEVQSLRDHWLFDAPVACATRPGFECWYAPLRHIRDDIFGCRNMEELVTKHLNKSGRGYVVNFRGLVTADRPNTVEFRQHAGTLDVEEMTWWIRYCVGMVRLAHGLADRGAVPSCKDWDVAVELITDDLWNLVGFPQEGRDFNKDMAERNGPRPVSMVFELAPPEEVTDRLSKGLGKLLVR